MKIRGALLLIPAALALAACTSAQSATPTTTTATSSSSAQWPPSAAWTATGALAWHWTPTGGFKCKSYQDSGCWGITITTQSPCPNGVYIEIAILNEAGTTIDKANDITASLAPGEIAQSVLAPPSATPNGAKARLSQLNCL